MIGNTNAKNVQNIYTQNKPFITGCIDMDHVHNIYMTSPNMSKFQTLGVRGESNIICKVPVTSSYGMTIVNSFTSPHDYLDCSNLTLSQIEIELRDIRGNIIPLHGAHVSFTMVFSLLREDT